MRKAEIKIQNTTAGWLSRDDEGYHFVYDTAYLASKKPVAVSLNKKASLISILREA